MSKLFSTKLILIILLPVIIGISCIPSLGLTDDLKDIKLPKGFKISLYAKDIEGVRSMTRSESGILFVGTRKNDKVYALIDSNNDNKIDQKFVIDSGLNSPNGVAFKEGSLYVAEINRVLRYDNIEKRLKNPPKPVVVNDTFPRDRHHGWKYIAFGPDDKLYVPVGAPCNVCFKKDKRYSSIMRMDADGKNLEIYAHGIRNTVGFSWHPTTKELWFTDNGRDWLGDNKPPDELNHAPQQGLHFGFPFIHGEKIADPKYGKNKKAQSFVPPARELGPHVAALGMKFYTGKMFPSKYHNQIFIAEHGSWNRTNPIGYRITLVELKDNKAISYKVFAKGWLKGSVAWGRPVDILILPDGSMLVSDDFNDAIYRITYEQ